MRAPRVIRAAAPAALALCVLASASAGAHPPGQARLPPVWTDPQCMTIVDRSVDPIVAIEYTVLAEEPPPEDNEPPDSGTFQFFSFCRDLEVLTDLPNWITRADVEVAAEYGLVNPNDPALDTEILDERPDWDSCWARITPDDARIPITEAAAEQPVLWDTSALEAGTWLVEGYTYEPWINAWTSHPGIFKIVDDPDPAASGPAAALTFQEKTTFVGASVPLDGCIDAMAGSTMTLSWAGYPTTLVPEDQPSASELEWEVIAELPVENGAFVHDWTIPEHALGLTALIKLDVVDPMGRSWTAHGAADIGVAGGGGGGTSGSGDGDTGEADAGAQEEEEDSDGGCSCSANPRDALPRGAWLVLIGFAACSRRRAAHRRRRPHT